MTEFDRSAPFTVTTDTTENIKPMISYVSNNEFFAGLDKPSTNFEHHELI